MRIIRFVKRIALGLLKITIYFPAVILSLLLIPVWLPLWHLVDYLIEEWTNSK